MKPNHNRLRPLTMLFAAPAFFVGTITGIAQAADVPPILITPDSIDTRIGKLEFKDGAPSADTISKVYDTLAFTR